MTSVVPRTFELCQAFRCCLVSYSLLLPHPSSNTSLDDVTSACLRGLFINYNNTDDASRQCINMAQTTLLVVPREIGDQIYDHQLRPVAVREKQDDTTVVRHRFYAAILSINKQLHDEAQEHIFKNNTFGRCKFASALIGNQNDLFPTYQIPFVVSRSRASLSTGVARRHHPLYGL